MSESSPSLVEGPHDGAGARRGAVARPSADHSLAAHPSGGHAVRWTVILAAAAFALYLPSMTGGYVYDDASYVRNNPHLRRLDADTLRWSLTHAYLGNWHALTWLSHAADVALFGYEDPTGHHIANVVLHALNVALLCIVLARMTGYAWRAVAVAAIFAFHPINVESVAWISERKNVLCTFFLLLTLLAYHAYTQRPAVWRYLLVMLAFAAGLASKPMLVTLPLALLLLDYWPLRRLSGRAVVEKVPLLFLSAGSALITWRIQMSAGAGTPLAVIGVFARLQNAAISYVRYLGKAFWPDYLAPFYPYPRLEAPPYPNWAMPAAVLLLVIVSAAVVLQVRRRPYLFTGWCWYLGTLVPVIGFAQVGRQSMADRFAYIPLIGIYVAVVWLVAELRTRRTTFRSAALGKVVAGGEPVSARLPAGSSGIPPGMPEFHPATISNRPPAGPVIMMVLINAVLGVLTLAQINHWHDAVSLWRHTLAAAPQSPIALKNLAIALYHDGSPENLTECERLFRDAIFNEIDANHRALMHYQLGRILLEQPSRRLDGLNELAAAVNDARGDPDYRKYLANALYEVGRNVEAEEHYLAALGLEATPAQQADVHRNYAVLLDHTDRPDEAVAHARQALSLDDGPDSFAHLAVILKRAGREDEALVALREGLLRYPEDAGLRRRLDQLTGREPPPAP